MFVINWILIRLCKEIAEVFSFFFLKQQKALFQNIARDAEIFIATTV